MTDNRSLHPRVDRYAREEVGVLYRDFDITPSGYSQKQVQQNRARYGENRLTESTADTVLYRLRRAFVNPFAGILFVLAVLSFITDVLLASDRGRDWSTPGIMLAMLLLSGVVRFVQELRSKRVADHLTRLLHATVSVQRDGRWTELPSTELVVGDRVRLAAGDRAPADLRLVKAEELFVSQAVLTGESAVLEKQPNPLPVQPVRSYAGYTNIVFMGSAVIGGTGEGIVLAVGQDTVYGGLTGTAKDRKNGFDRGAHSIAWVLIRFMTVLVPVVFLACGLSRGNWLAAFLYALSVAVGLTPEMLPMVVNACLAKGSAAMSRKQTVVKNINAMQGFGSMDVLCVDKTGTLTGDTVQLEYYMDLLGNESTRVLELAYLNSLYHTGVQNHLDAAILRCRAMPGQEAHFQKLAQVYPKLDELPFDYERKFASVLVGQPSGENLLVIKGGIEEVCARCTQIEYKGERFPLEKDGLASVHAVVDEMLEDGMKVLAVACKPFHGDRLCADAEQGCILLGYVAFFDAPKKSAAAAIASLQKCCVGVRVLTGDQMGVAVSICRRLGIDTRHTLTGGELEQLTPDELPLRLERTTVFAELSPRQKARILHTLQENGHTVGFLGDGMNDLPAMLQADVGISVDTAAEAVQESADVILLKKDLQVLEAGILEGRKAFCNMAKYIRITSSSNFGNILSVVVAGICLPFFPMTSAQLLLLNLLYDTLCLVLPWDAVDAEACARPLEWSGRTLGRFMRCFGPLSSLLDLCTFAFLYFILCPAACGGAFATLNDEAARQHFIALFQTGWLLESLWTQVLILHLLRTRKVPFLQSRPSRPVMIVTMLGLFALTAMTFTPAGHWLGLMALPPLYFGFLVQVVLLYLLLVTLAKSWYCKRYRELL